MTETNTTENITFPTPFVGGKKIKENDNERLTVH